MKAIRNVPVIAAVCLFSFSVCHALPADAGDAAAAVIPVTCLAMTNTGSHTYEIRIESDENAPVPDSDVLLIPENGTGSFEVPVTEPGTFRYRVYETAGTSADVEYDSTVYDVIVYTDQDADGALLCTVTASVQGSDTKVRRIEFADTDTSVTETTDVPSVETSLTPVETHPVTDIPGESDENSTTSATVTTVSTSAAVTTVTTTTPATAPAAAPGSPLTEFVSSVLTGDSFPAHTVRAVLIASLLAAVFAVLFRRRHREEEDEHEK